MRKRLTWMLILTTLGAFACTAVATAQWSVFRFGNVVLKAEGVVLPRARPKNELTPAFFAAKGEISTVDGTHPPADREAILNIDKNGAIDPVGLPMCAAGQLEARDSKSAKRVCGDSIVGSGQGVAEIAFPEQKPIFVHSPLTLFNGGIKGGTTTIFIHAFITVPSPAAIVTTVKISKIHSGRYGLRAVIKVPVIAGGSGSVRSFEIKFGRYFNYKGKKKSYDLAKCPDGHLDTKIVKTVFKDETGESSDATLSGTLVSPCTPKG
jgi:hypothetical protein